MSEQQWKLVPVEPTEEMRKAIFGLLSAYDDGSDIAPSFFMKMLLNAVPQPPSLCGEPEPFGLIYRDGSNAIIQLVGDPHIKDGMPVYGESEVAQLQAEVERLSALLDTPHTADWFEGVKLEAGHQIKRWGTEHDAGKTPADWFWLIGYLSQKAMTAQMAGDDGKARHHTISTGAAMLNWFRAIVGDSNAMRPGIDAALAEGAKS